MNSTPISPSLVIFSAHVLRTGLTNLFQNGKFQAFSMAIGGPSISHLAFAEDMGGVTLWHFIFLLSVSKRRFSIFPWHWTSSKNPLWADSSPTTKNPGWNCHSKRRGKGIVDTCLIISINFGGKDLFCFHFPDGQKLWARRAKPVLLLGPMRSQKLSIAIFSASYLSVLLIEGKVAKYLTLVLRLFYNLLTKFVDR